MNHRRLKPYYEVFDELGCRLVDTSTTGHNHYKMVVSCNGHERFFIAPYSPSDTWRGLKNFRSDVKKWVTSTKQCGDCHDPRRANR